MKPIDKGGLEFSKFLKKGGGGVSDFLYKKSLVIEGEGLVLKKKGFSY